MEMINRCLEITADKRAELEEFDRRKGKRMKMMEERAEWRDQSPTFGNRKERRRLAALERQGKETA
jgi:hypothetical protein